MSSSRAIGESQANNSPLQNLIENFNTPIIVSNILIVCAISFSFVFFPEVSIGAAEAVSTWVGNTFTSAILWWAFGTLMLAVWFCGSKYGSIKMGEGSPDYSNFQYIVMMGFAGFGSGTMYWAFLEWASYVHAPARGLESMSQQAYEWAVPYAMHHWGLTGWAIFAVSAIPVMYFFYHRKINSLKLGELIVHMSPNKQVGRVIGGALNAIYPTALIITLVTVPSLGVPVLSGAFSTAFGIADGFTLKAALVAIIVAVLATSTMLGLEKGMSRICSWGGYGLVALLIYITLAGPTLFIMDNTTSSVGHWFQNFITMNLYTDSVGGSGFTQSWTTFFWGYWATYIPLMAVFIAKVSKGRTIRNILTCCMLGGTTGVSLLFAITGSFMMNLQLNDIIPVIDMLNSGLGTQAIAEGLGTLPVPALVMFIFLFTTLLLLISTLDGAAFTMACNTQKKLDENANPSRVLKVIWAAVLVAVPLSVMAAGASISAIQSSIYLLVVPMAGLGAYMCVCAVKCISADFGHLTRNEIEAMYAESDKEKSLSSTPYAQEELTAEEAIA